MQCIHQPAPNVMKWEHSPCNHLPEPQDLVWTIEPDCTDTTNRETTYESLQWQWILRPIPADGLYVSPCIAEASMNGYSLNKIYNSFECVVSVPCRGSEKGCLRLHTCRTPQSNRREGTYQHRTIRGTELSR